MAQRCLQCISILLVASALTTVSACRDLAHVTRTNQLPVANAGPDEEHTVEGEVEVTLDGSKSMDPDGKIVRYRWLSANAGERDGGGVIRVGPDPDDKKKPTVTLDEGVWTFTLWVEDDDGLLSAPDNVVIAIGKAVDPRVTECAQEVLQTVSEECRLCVCDIDQACRDSAAESECDQECWDLMFCIDEMCGDIDSDDTDSLASCVTNDCAEFLGGGLAIQGVDPCRRQCPDVCSADAQTGGAQMDDEEAMGPAAMCAQSLPDSVPDACRTCICDIDDHCREAATACDEPCWDLFACIDQNCPDKDGECVTSMCADLLGAALTIMDAGPCRDQCPTECDLSMD